MSIPFTVNAENWQEADKLEELRLAFSERFKSVYNVYRRFVWRETDAETGAGIWEWQDGDGTIADVLSPGVNLQAEEFWSYMQQLIETIAVYIFIDPSTNWAGVAYPVPYAATHFNTWLNFCQTVGGSLYVDDTDYGWPRSVARDELTGDPVMLRGQHQAGDYIGGWMIDSLVEAFGYLTTDCKYIGGASYGVRKGYVGEGNNNAEAYAAALVSGSDFESPSILIGGLISYSPGLPRYCTIAVYTRTSVGAAAYFPLALRKRYAYVDSPVVGNGGTMLASMGVPLDGTLALVSSDDNDIGPTTPAEVPASLVDARGLAAVYIELRKYDYTNA